MTREFPVTELFVCEPSGASRTATMARMTANSHVDVAQAPDGPTSAELRPTSAHGDGVNGVGPALAEVRPKSAQGDGDEAPDAAGPGSAEVRPNQARQRSDRAIAAVAQAQHNTVTLGQIEALGLSGRALRHRAVAGRLHRLHHGVYAVECPGSEGRWMAAVLACGPGAVLSHRSAAALWGIAEDRGAAVDVSAPHRAGRSRPGIAAHRGGRLEDIDVTTHRGIPCTSLERTLLDLAGVVGRRSLERAVDRAEELRTFDLRKLEDIVDRCRGRRGVRALAGVIAAYDGPAVSRSEAEERFLSLVVEAGLERPRMNAWIPLDEGSGYSPDFLWTDARLIVEVDGRTYHAKQRAFTEDRRRDRRLALAGFETRRYAAAEVFDEPTRVVDELSTFLQQRRAA